MSTRPGFENPSVTRRRLAELRAIQERHVGTPIGLDQRPAAPATACTAVERSSWWPQPFTAGSRGHGGKREPLCIRKGSRESLTRFGRCYFSKRGRRPSKNCVIDSATGTTESSPRSRSWSHQTTCPNVGPESIRQ